MPYKSDSQRKFFHAAEERGEMPHKVVHEFDQASKGMSLPEHVKKAQGGFVNELKRQKRLEHLKKMWRGGNVDDDSVDHLNSSGEPHTNALMEEEHPMEFMAGGGMVADSNYPTPEVMDEKDMDSDEKDEDEEDKLGLSDYVSHMAHGGKMPSFSMALKKSRGHGY